MKKTLLTITFIGATILANATTTTNYIDAHDISNSKSKIFTKYIEIHDTKNSKSTQYLQK